MRKAGTCSDSKTGVSEEILLAAAEERRLFVGPRELQASKFRFGKGGATCKLPGVSMTLNNWVHDPFILGNEPQF